MVGLVWVHYLPPGQSVMTKGKVLYITDSSVAPETHSKYPVDGKGQLPWKREYLCIEQIPQKECNIPQRPDRNNDFSCPQEERQSTQCGAWKGERTPLRHTCRLLLGRGSGGTWGGHLQSDPPAPTSSQLHGGWCLWGAGNNTGLGSAVTD